MNRVSLSPVWRVLAQLADLAVIGALTALGCVGAVTAPAAIAAGIVASSEEVPTATARRFWAEFRPACRFGMLYGAIGVVLTGLAVIDLLLVASVSEPIARVIGVMAGSLLLLLVACTGPYVGLVLKTRNLTLRQGLRTVPALIVLAPGGLVQAFSLTTLLLASLLLFPLAAVVLLGAYVRLGAQLELRIERRLRAIPGAATTPSLTERTS